jgi:hypothetical protein
MIAGLTSGTSSLVKSVSFVSMEDFAAVRGGGDVVSFVLVKIEQGESPAVASPASPKLFRRTAQTRLEFASQSGSWS